MTANPAILGFLLGPGFLLAVLPAVGTALWLRYGRGPRRRRAYRQVQRLLQQKAWREAMTVLATLKLGAAPSQWWQGRIRQAEGEAQRLAGDEALAEKRFEESLERYQDAARLLGMEEAGFRARVLETMLAELRLRFGTDANHAVRPLIDQVLKVEPAHAEALFWQGLCHARAGQVDAALEALRTSAAAQPRNGPGVPALDPLLYLGAIQLREGRTHEALRALAEANRLSPDCPIVLWQLGTAIAAAGGDALAVRALQRALGPRGLAQWIKVPQRAWVEGMPGETDDPQTNWGAREPSAGPRTVSYVRRLARMHVFRCPVLGRDVTEMIGQAQLALAQVHFRQDRLEEAVRCYQAVLQECPPSLPVLRGLGLALARLGRYDQAFTHLRAAYEREPSDYIVAGYLALCGARGKPNRPEDKANNIAWSLRLLARFTVHGDPQWAAVYSAIGAEARTHRLPIPAADQRRLCDALASVEATDPDAAAAYEELSATCPEVHRPEFAWLYCRGAQLHGAGTPRGLKLFEQTCRDATAARAYFEQRQWDFTEVEYTYLQRFATFAPDPAANVATARLARFTLSPSHEELLLDRSRRHEADGKLEEAIASVELLVRLTPGNHRAWDRLARLHYQQGNLARAAEYLAEWRDREPSNHWPLLRLAVVEQQRGNSPAARQAVRQALPLTRGAARAAAAFVGARLALADFFAASAEQARCEARDHALFFLQDCLCAEPRHSQALWCLAALYAIADDRPRLVALAPAMCRPEVNEPAFHFLAAVCHLAAEEYVQAEMAAQRARETGIAVDPIPRRNGKPQASPKGFSLARECAYLIGLARLFRHDLAGADEELRPLPASESPAVDHARALLGRISFALRHYEEASRWWGAVEPGRRAAWRLDCPLQQTVLLSAVLALGRAEYQRAIDQLRQAGRLGGRDRRLGPLLVLAQVKEAYRLLHLPPARLAAPAAAPETYPFAEPVGNGTNHPPTAAEQAAALLKKAIQAGCQEPDVAYLLAVAYKQKGNVAEARAVLRSIARPDAHVFLQLGLLDLREANTSPVSALQLAERELAQAWSLCAQAQDRRDIVFPIGYNLLRTRLTLGTWIEAAPLVPPLAEHSSTSEERHLLGLLRVLFQNCQTPLRDGALVAGPAAVAPADVQALVAFVRQVGHLDTAATLLKSLAAARPDSQEVLEAHIEATLLRAKKHLQRCEATSAKQLLAPLARQQRIAHTTRVALLNLLGCAAYCVQDFEESAHHFAAALNLAVRDARIQQNAALAYEQLARSHGSVNRYVQADEHWNRYLDLLDGRIPVPAGHPDYLERLAFECLNRLARRHADREDWANALPFLQRAHHLRPLDAGVLDQLVNLYGQLRRPDEARQALLGLRRLRGDGPQLDWYELEFFELKNLDDVERTVNDLDRILRQQPRPNQVGVRVQSILNVVIDFMTNLSRQYGDRLNKTGSSLNRLPTDQIDWVEMNDLSRELYACLQRLKRCIDLCFELSTVEPQRRQLERLRRNIDGGMDLCKTLCG